jgi:hypothetical protein
MAVTGSHDKLRVGMGDVPINPFTITLPRMHSGHFFTARPLNKHPDFI